MKKSDFVQKPEQLLGTIVRTVLSTEPVNPEVLRAHIREYAHVAGIPYNLAVANVTLHVRAHLTARFEQL